MHELSIAQNIVEIVEQHVSPDERHAVREVRIRVGELAGVLADSLEFCYSAIIANTALQHSRLTIDVLPLTMRCTSCGNVFESSRGFIQCPSCATYKTEMIHGDELTVTEIEMAELIETS